MSCFFMVAKEIRPAPHMDNLVGIYKSMETASAGVNMFMSESAPSSQLPGYVLFLVMS